MIIEITSWIAVILIFVAASGLLLSRDWRWSMGLLAVIYLAAFWMAARHWPVGMASVKLVTGWMVAAALGMTRLGIGKDEGTVESFGPRGIWFRIFLAGIVGLLTLAGVPRIEAIIPGMGSQVVAGGLLLIGLGLIHLGITDQILRVILGLLTMLAGFEIIYAAVESSILVAGMLAVVNLGLALVGSYLMMANSATEQPS